MTINSNFSIYSIYFLDIIKHAIQRFLCISLSDVAAVWENVSGFIEKQMAQQKVCFLVNIFFGYSVELLQ